MATLSAISQLGLNSNITLSGTAIVEAADSDPVWEVIGSAVDTDYVYSSTNSSSSNTADVLLNWPTDFDNPSTTSSLSVQLRYLLQTGTRVNSWDTLSATLVDSSGTALSNTVTVASSITTTTATNSATITITGLNTTAGSAVWQAAKLRVTIDITRSMGGDTLEKRVTAAQVTGTYDVLIVNYPIAGDNGTYALTGQAATILKTSILTADQGSYALT